MWSYYHEGQNIRCSGVIRDRRASERGTPDRRQAPRRDRECKQVVMRVGRGQAWKARRVAQAGEEPPTGVGSTHFCQRCRAVTELEPVALGAALAQKAG